MIKYVKFLDKQSVQYAPRNYNGVSNYDQDSGRLVKDGYKPLVVIEEPTEDKPLIRYRDTKEQIEQYAEALTVQEKNEQIRQQRQSRFRIEADPLKLDYDEVVARGEDAEKARIAWLSKKDLIRSELPYIEE